MSTSPTQPELIDMQALERAAECLRTLAHPVRLRMVQMLLRGDYNVGELAEACKIPSHMASEHLRLMQHCGLLTRRQEGRQTFYQIGEPHLVDIMHCIETRFAGTPPADSAEQ
ncbi:MAG: ArsR/SmtB family transcription factor [Pirellulales bacterium]